MSNITYEFSKFGINWANVRVERWTDSSFLQVIPITISIGSGSVVVSNDVVRMGNPHATWSLISVKKTP
jgi:hypothetical protein